MIEVYPDAEALARAAAERIATNAKDRVDGRFTIALAGGSTPMRAYELLAQEPLRDSISYENVDVYWGDERCVSIIDERNNAQMARRAWLGHVPISRRHVHSILCENDARAGASAYDRELHEALGYRETPLDLVLLGMGVDGHTAALFPGSMALEETVRWTAVVKNRDEDIHRITMTLPLLNRARQAMFIVSGESKAEMLRVIIEDKGGPQRLPASRIKPSGGEPLWLVDAAAASLLTGNS